MSGTNVWRAKRLLYLLAFVFATLLLSACGSARFSSTFAEDGTASHSLEVAFQRASIIQRDQTTLLQEIDDAVLRAEAAGLTIRRINTNDMIGVRLSSTTENAVDAGAALNNLLNTLLPDTDLGPIAPFQGTFERESEAVGGNEFQLRMVVDGDLLLRTVQAQAPGNRQLGTPEGVREVVAIDYTATLPGQVKKTTGATIDRNTVRWGIPLDGVTTIEATSTIGKETPWFWLLMTIAAAATLTLVTAVIVTSVMLSLRRKGSARLRIAPATVNGGADQIAGPKRAPATVGEVGDALRHLIRRMVSARPGAHPPDASNVSDGPKTEQETADGVHTERD